MSQEVVPVVLFGVGLLVGAYIMWLYKEGNNRP